MAATSEELASQSEQMVQAVVSFRVEASAQALIQKSEPRLRNLARAVGRSTVRPDRQAADKPGIRLSLANQEEAEDGAFQKY